MNVCNGRPPSQLRMRLNTRRRRKWKIRLRPVMEEIANETTEMVRLVPHERVQRQTAEPIEDAPQYPAAQKVENPLRPVTEEIANETTEMVRLVPHERVQRQTAEPIEDAPQYPAAQKVENPLRPVMEEIVNETSEMVRLVPLSAPTCLVHDDSMSATPWPTESATHRAFRKAIHSGVSGFVKFQSSAIHYPRCWYKLDTLLRTDSTVTY